MREGWGLWQVATLVPFLVKHRRSHPTPLAQRAGVDLAQGSTIEGGHMSAPTRDPALHFGPKLGFGKAGPGRDRALW